MGTGKSSLSQKIFINLKNNGSQVKWFHEVTSPIIDQNLLWQEKWDSLKYKKKIILNWEKLIKQIKNNDDIYIVESSFFQISLMWLKCFNVTDKDLKYFAAQIENIIKEINPTIIYFDQEIYPPFFKHICEERGQGFVNSILERIGKSPYGIKNNIKTIKDIENFSLYFKKISDSVFDELELNKLKIDNSRRDWFNYENKIMNFLNIPISGITTNINLNELEGFFRKVEDNREIEFRIMNNKLVSFNVLYFQRELIYVETDTFYLKGYPIQINFKRNHLGEISGLEISELFRDEVKLRSAGVYNISEL